MKPLSICIAMLCVNVLTVTAAVGQTLNSDKSDYNPGETATLTGSGFQGGEEVTVRVVHADGTPSTGADHDPWTVTADGAGGFVTTWHVCEDDCVGSLLRATADGASGTHAEVEFTDNHQQGNGVATVTANGGSCIAFTPATGSGPDQWEVAEGGSYTMTITGVTATECAGGTITVFVQGSPSNFCFNATGGSGTYSGTFTMPNPACNTYPISYKCGTNASCNHGGSLSAKGPSSTPSDVHTVLLRASTFDGNCNRTGDDTNCALCTPCTITCPPNRNLACGESTNPSNTGTATSTGCTVTFTDATVAAGCGGVAGIDRTWKATKACGSSVTCVQQIRFVDNTAPTFSGVGGPETIECPAQPAFSNPTASDDCDPSPSLTSSDATTPGTCPQEYSVTRTWTATDACGNSSQASQTVTVEDNKAPVITCPPHKKLQSGESTDPSNTGSAIATDDCDNNPTITYSDQATGGGCAGGIDRTWKATDACGNEATCVQNVTFADNTRPVITCPADKELQCGSSTAPSNTGSATATDNCDSNPTITYSDASSAAGCAGVASIDRTWKATDASGNEATCIQRIRFVDTTKPVITCPSNRALPRGASTHPSNTGTATATDNCGGNVTITYSDKPTGGCTQDFEYNGDDLEDDEDDADNADDAENDADADDVEVGKDFDRTWKATDACGNEATCVQHMAEASSETMKCDRRVAAGTDDAEESATGSVSLTSSDLELITDGSAQTVGVRFPALTIPRGAVITNAYVQFAVDEVTSGAIALTIRAQAADKAAAFTTVSRNLSSRARTAASVAWAPAAWPTTGTASAAQRTPDLSALVAEVTGRTGWVSGNAIVVLVTGTGKRTAQAFEGDRTRAPLLHVEYLAADGGPPPSPVNAAPVVDAGPNRTVTLPGEAALAATVSDDGLPVSPGALGLAWSLSSGPAGVTFVDPAAAATVARFAAEGTYVLRLTANDGQLSVSDSTTIVVQSGGLAPVTLDRRVAAGTDDAEESATGSVSLTSSDLELVTDGSAQTVGVRFAALAIPRGAVITNAYVQFAVDEVTSGAIALTIRAQAADQAAAFTTASRNLSSRARTAASVAWAPAAWPTIGTASAAQRTPDLSALVAEVTGRTGWASGNAIVVLITGTGKRTAQAFEGDRTRAPLLHVEYVASAPIPSAMPAAPQASASTSGLPAKLAAFVVPSPLDRAGTLHLDVPRGGRVTIQLFDVGGRVVRELLDAPYLAPGRHSFTLDPRGATGRRLAAGVYFYRVKASAEQTKGRIVVVE